MYRPAYSRMDDEALVARLVREHPFATLVRVVDGEPLVVQAPLYAVPGGLEGHLARSNPFVHDLDGAAVTALFTGPDGYVSPSWYAAPAEHVPTWNYVSVEARGRARVVPPEPVLARAVETHEATWRVDPALEAQLARGIVAFVLEVLSWEGKAKLSQNRDGVDRDRVEQRFAGTELGAWMRAVR